MRAKIAENQARLILSSRFPSIKQLRIHYVFLDARQRTLNEETVTLGPCDPAAFTLPCPGRCGKGSFDFTDKLKETAGAGLAFSEASAKCPESLYASSLEACGCEIKCRMDIEYFPGAVIGDAIQ